VRNSIAGHRRQSRYPSGIVRSVSRTAQSHAVHVHPPHRSVAGGLARASVFGMNDGLVSNVSLVIGFAGSGVNPSIVRLAGIAGAIAGSVSMAAGEWISISAQNELAQREIDVERRSLRVNEAAEQRELAQMYEGHGMEPATARQAADEVMRNPKKALTVHSREELGIDPVTMPSPWKAAALSFVCFVIGALLPVIPWFSDGGNGAKVASVAIGVVAAAILGWVIGQFAERNRAFSAFRQVAILLVACAVTYGVGQLLDVTVT
jgi:vacuolar iron transporter family protein